MKNKGKVALNNPIVDGGSPLDKQAVVIKNRSLPQDPIFIVGYPRSGTTLLQSLLATQGNIVTFPETHFFHTLLSRYEKIPDAVPRDHVWELLKEISRVSGIAFSEPDLALLGYLDWIPTKDLFEFVVWSFFPKSVPDDFRWLEKTPDHAFCLEDLRTFYPKAKFVGMVRHPFPAILSRTRNFPPKVQNPLDYLSRQWVLYGQAMENFRQKYPDKIVIIKYENLAQFPPEVVSAIANFLSVEFDSAALSQRVVKTNTIIRPFEHWKANVRNPEIRNNNGEVGKLFSLGDTLKIQAIVLSLMRRFGYSGEYLALQPVYQLFCLRLPWLAKRVTGWLKNTRPQ